MIRLEIYGLKEFTKNINSKFKKQTFEWAMSNVMKEAKRISTNELCPFKTGMLHDSIYVRKTGDYTYEIGATMYYGVWHEYGSYNINAGTVENPNLIKTGYSPFLRPALWRAIKKFPHYINQKWRVL